MMIGLEPPTLNVSIHAPVKGATIHTATGFGVC